MAEASAQMPHLPWERGKTASGPTDTLTHLADEILARCRGEGPANCVARCPLRVDARGYVQLTREGRFQEALQLVRERLPFPGVLGYVCTHPCELHCKRIDDDSAIRIRDIKRFLAEWEPGEPRHIVEREAARVESVAVVGAGPAGLIAAHDLARLGYWVTLIDREETIGGCLTHKIPEYRLPRPVLQRDLSIIDALGIDLRTDTELGGDVALDDLRKEHRAVLLLLGYEGGLRFLRAGGAAMRRTVRDTLWSDPLTGETGIPGLFAGGETVSGPSSVIDALAQGRRAAESVHRYLNHGKLRVDREAPLPSGLLWTLEIDESLRQRRERTPVMLEPFNAPLGEARARLEAERCLDCECAACVRDCEFLSAHCDSPKELARRVKRGFDDATLKTIYSCNLCSLCAEVCPENLDTGALLAEARRRAVERGQAPLLPQHKRVIDYYRTGVSRTLSLVQSEPGRGRSKRLFFPGCALPAVAPRHTLRIYDELRRNYPGTGVLAFCCGAPAASLGLEEPLAETMRQIVRHAESVGAEELITACPDCSHMFETRLPGLPARSIWELLAEDWRPPRKRNGEEVVIHDACKTRHNPALQAAVRRLVEQCGGRVRELEYSAAMTRCCGSGGLLEAVDPGLCERIAQRRGGESPLPLLTYCASCRRVLGESGAKTVHLLEFLFDPDLPSLSRARPPGRFARYFNRLRTKWAFKRLRPLDAE